MELSRSYLNPSSVQTKGNNMGFSLATDLSRPGVFLNAEVKDSLVFARTMLVLHRIVCTNMIKVPKDYSKYQSWVQGQYLKELPEAIERKDLEGLLKNKESVQEEVSFLEKEIQDNPITRSKDGYHEALSRFWQWLYKVDEEAWYVLDPVVSVQPDSVIFEAFSLDESMYGRVSLPNKELDLIEPLQRGTTNIDFSEKLANEFDRVRSYRPLTLKVGQDSVKISTELASRVEKKIDLPESWVKGFLEVQSASALPTLSLNLTPATVSDLLVILENHKDNVSPKALKFILEPNKKPEIEIEPWGIKLIEQEHVYTGTEKETVRIWGRKRLLVLKELLPLSSHVLVNLLGSGLPSFWSLKTNEIELDLGLSGWSANDWASQAKFSLMSGQEKIDNQKLTRISALLKESEGLLPDQIMERTGFSRAEVVNGLQKLCSMGQAMFDFHKHIYRWRELFPAQLLPKMEEENDTIKKAKQLLETHQINLVEQHETEQGRTFKGKAINNTEMNLTFNADGRAVKMNCSCYEFKKTKLRKGPCHHLIALMKLSET